jgi:hypothetical protein
VISTHSYETWSYASSELILGCTAFTLSFIVSLTLAHCHRRNAMDYNPRRHEIHGAARKLLDLFRNHLLVQFKREQLSSVRSSFLNPGLKPNSSVAVLKQKQSEAEFRKSLLPSSSTLLVIPLVLMEHWQVSARSLILGLGFKV